MQSIYVWLLPALTALFLYGLGQGFVKKYIGDVSPARFCLFFIVARSLVGMGYFLTQDHPPPFQEAGRAFMACVILVYLLDGVGWILYYKSILVGPITIVGTLSAAYPALTVVFAAAFLGEVLNPLQYLGVTLVLAGCMGMAYSPADPDQPRPQRGWIFMAASALVLWGGAQTLLKYAYGLPEASETNVMLYMNFGGWMTLGVYGLLRGRLPAREGTMRERTREWVHSMLPMGMMAGGDAAVIVATRYGPVSVVTPLTAAYPVVTIAFASLILKEKVTPLQYASIGATLAGMYLTI
ncbi:MAG: DMT family transporter [Armatimonadetes bacterium]|nr:DMT family transporter [Armatimonadota bacterium]